MFRIALNAIYLTKGDTARFEIALAQIPKVNTSYELTDEDEIYFIVTREPEIVKLEDLDTSSNVVFYKQGRNIVINPEDTEVLETGDYYHQVRVILRISGDVNTIIEPSGFHITPGESR